ncbi:MAG: LysR family transcriptional regulator [Sphingomonadales bacterium]|nr:LysR family transcriptional regulator [Sphingomonadales bacterium]
MEMARLRHILAVARTRSFSRAAEEEGITQPALSRSIAAFEHRHGAQLFDRGRGGVHVTPAGTLVIEQARKLLAAADDLERGLKLYGRGEAGRLAFGLGPLLASLFLPGLAQSLLGSRPGLQIVTSIRPPEQLIPELIGDGIEMILGNDWRISKVPGTVLEPLGKLKLAVIARAGHPLAAAAKIAVGDLDDYPTASAIEPPTGMPRGKAGTFVCDNFFILRETVRNTDCTWITSPAFLADDLHAGTLVELRLADFDTGHSDICVVYRQGRTRSPVAIEVTEAVRGLLGASA